MNETISKTYGAKVAYSLFAGRKGHGGGPCSYRVMRPDQLAQIIAEAFKDGHERAALTKEAAISPEISAILLRAREFVRFTEGNMHGSSPFGSSLVSDINGALNPEKIP